jgi:hypothetical protein
MDEGAHPRAPLLCGPRAVWWIAAAVFVLALALRLLFWRALPGAHWPYSPAYKGDANLWLTYAQALQQGAPFTQGIPLHPPGMGYLVALLWDGTAQGIVRLRAIWCGLGALGVLALFAAAHRAFGLRVAIAAALLGALSTGMIVLSSSLNNEAPYLVLVLASIALVPRLLREPRLLELAAWSALHAGACLLRVEHALFFAFSFAHLAWSWKKAASVRLGGPAALSVLVFVLVLAPWHAKAWSGIAAFNRGDGPPLAPRVEQAYRAIEERTSALVWEEEAQRLAEELPAFIRRPARGFVAATRLHRGESSVRAEDLEILREAYGAWPEPIAAHPFVSSYGPLNFALANHAQSNGGFRRGPLNDAAPLEGGAQSYPPDLVAGLPPPTLALTYVPHLAIFNKGYARGWAWIGAYPGQFLALVGRKLERFASGATLGLGGANLPLGMSGERASVDLVVPERDAISWLWTLVLLGLAAAGWRHARRRPELVPWLLFLLSKLVATVLFFGYARQGASVVPVLAVLIALLIDRLLSRPWLEARAGLRRNLIQGAVLVVALVVAFDAARGLSGVQLTIDGAIVEDADPFPPADHEDRTLVFGR